MDCILWTALADAWNPRRGHENLWFTASRSEAQVTAWTCDWHLKSWKIGTWCCLQVDSVRTELFCRTPSWGWGIARCVGNKHIWYQVYPFEYYASKGKTYKWFLSYFEGNKSNHIVRLFVLLFYDCLLIAFAHLLKNVELLILHNNFEELLYGREWSNVWH